MCPPSRLAGEVLPLAPRPSGKPGMTPPLTDEAQAAPGPSVRPGTAWLTPARSLIGCVCGGVTLGCSTSLSLSFPTCKIRSKCLQGALLACSKSLINGSYLLKCIWRNNSVEWRSGGRASPKPVSPSPLSFLTIPRSTWRVHRRTVRSRRCWKPRRKGPWCSTTTTCPARRPLWVPCYPGQCLSFPLPHHSPICRTCPGCSATPLLGEAGCK